MSDGVSASKACSKCKAVKPLEEFYLRSDGQGTTGRQSACKECVKGRQRRYNAAHPEVLAAQSRRWRQANPERQRELVREYMRRWREANPERASELAREYKRRQYGWYDEGGMATDQEMEQISGWKL